MTTTMDQAARMLEVVERAAGTHQLRHVEADRTGPVAAGVAIPDAPAFYVVRRKLAPPSAGEGARRGAPVWTVVHACVDQAAAVDWIDGDLERPDDQEAGRG